MSDNLVLELLRSIRGELGVVSADIREIKHRLTLLEIGQAAIRRDIAGLYELQAGASLCTDKLEDRVLRIAC